MNKRTAPMIMTTIIFGSNPPNCSSAWTTTPAPTTPPTITVNCTDDGSNIAPGAFLIQNDRDSQVMADNGFGKTVLQERIAGDLTQEWMAAPLCNGAAKVINVGTG